MSLGGTGDEADAGMDRRVTVSLVPVKEGVCRTINWSLKMRQAWLECRS